jgi:hypothetical protein
VTNGTNGNPWKHVATFLAGLVIAMVSFYVAEYRHTITRADAAQLVEDMRPGPPWAQDRAFVMGALEYNRKAVGECVTRHEWQARGK